MSDKGLRRLGRRLVARLRRAGADDLVQRRTADRDHILIGGCSRSGTTLVRVMMDSHRAICCGPESEVFLDAPLDLGKLEHRFKLDPRLLRDAYRRSRSRAEFIDAFADACCAATGKRRWAEKTPSNILSLDYVFANFPNAKFLHVLRDGRDVACSLRTHPRHRVEDGKLVPIDTWKPMDACAERWRDSLLATRRYWSDPRFYTVRYEELVSSPRPVMEDLLRFLGEEWDEAVLSHHTVASDFRDVAAFPQNPEAVEPIGNLAVGRWKRDMSEDDKQTFKAIAGDLLVDCGYASDRSW
jgi:hypothetical protein